MKISPGAAPAHAQLHGVFTGFPDVFEPRMSGPIGKVTKYKGKR